MANEPLKLLVETAIDTSPRAIANLNEQIKQLSGKLAGLQLTVQLDAGGGGGGGKKDSGWFQDLTKSLQEVVKKNWSELEKATTGLAVESVKKRFEPPKPEVDANATKQIGEQAENAGKLAQNLGKAGTASSLLKIGMSGLAATGVGAAFAVVNFGVEQLIGHFAKLREAEAKEAAAIKSYTNNGAQLQTLVNRYAELSASGMLASEQQKQLLEVQNQFIKLMPSVTSYIDAQGNARLKTVDSIKLELEHLKQLRDFQDRETLDKAYIARDKLYKTITGNEGKTKELEDDVKQAKKNDVFFVNGRAFPLSELQKNQYVRDAEKKLETNQHEIAQGYEEVNKAIIANSEAYIRHSGIVGELTEADKRYIQEQVQLQASVLKTASDQQEFNKRFSYVSDNIDKVSARLITLRNQLGDVGSAFSSEQLLQLAPNQIAVLQQLNATIGDNRNAWKSQGETLLNAGFTAQQSIAIIKAGLGPLKEQTDLLVRWKSGMDQLGNAYQVLNKGESLSSETLIQLIQTYPEIAKYINETNDLTLQKGVIVQQVAEAQREQALLEVDNELKSSTALWQSLENKRKLYEAYFNTIGYMLPDGTGMGSDIFSESDQKALDEQAQRMAELKVQREALNKPLPKPTLDSPGGSNRSVSAPVDPYVIDEYARAMRDLDTQLKESESLLAKYDKTSQDYRDQQQKTIDIQRQKQELAHNEADRLRGEIAGIRQRLDIEQLDQEQRNKLLQQLEQNETKLAELSRAWWDYESAAVSANEQIQESSFAFSKHWIEEQKKLKLLSLDEELAAWKRVQERYEAGSDERTEAEKEIARVQGEMAKAAEESNKRIAASHGRWVDETKNGLESVKKQYKELYEQLTDLEKKRHEERMNQLDREMERFEQSVNQELEAMDRQDDAQNYGDERTAKLKERETLIGRIALLSLNDGIGAKAEKRELQQQLDQMNDDIAKFERQRSRDVVKLNLQDRLAAKEKEVNDAKSAEDEKHKAIQDKLDATLNDEKIWTKLSEDVFAGHTQNVTAIFDSLSGSIKSVIAEIGSSIKKEMTDPLADSGTKLLNQLGQTASGFTANEQTARGTAVAAANQAQSGVGFGGGATGDDYQKLLQDNPEQRIRLIMQNMGFQEDWQAKLYLASYDDEYARSQIAYAKKKYDEYTKAGNTASAEAAHRYAQQIRDRNANVGSDPAYMDTGGYTGDFEGGKWAVLHKKEYVLSADNFRNILAAVNLSGSLVDRLKPFAPQIGAVAGGKQAGETKILNVDKLIHVEKMDKHTNLDVLMDQIDRRLKLNFGFGLG
ncbi:coiled-coil domain-containing protein [Paenibacillus cymbidii]|uniref:hypothetical protein n=1 Tax=Paenibacillus cymbidii TaxID=1639034 RepID=UPI0010813D23|nr:hypothetical protein [Paenibacillus cymbidii]